jgi:hypothetical protein
MTKACIFTQRPSSAALFCVRAMSPIAMILLMLALGYGLRRLGVPESVPRRLQWLVVYVLLPPLVWQAAQRIEWRADLALLAILPWLLGALAAALCWWIGRRLGWTTQTIGCLMMCSALGNTAFLGYPLIGALLGPTALPMAVIFDQLGTFLLLPVLALFVTRVYAGGGDRLSVRERAAELALGILKFPAIHALWIGLLPIAAPDWLQRAAGLMALALVPVAMLAVGMQLKLIPARATLAPAALGLAIKLALLPLVAGALLSALARPALMIETAMLQAAMPPMVTAGALAASADLHPKLAATLVGYGIVIGVLWVPLLATLV